MPLLPKLVLRRLGPVGVAWMLYDVWKRLPEKQRKQLLEQGRKHGSHAVRTIKQETTKFQNRRA